MKTAARREQILQAAYELTGQSGIEGLHARSVGAKLGINHAAVHYYFPKRADLLKGLIEHTADRFQQDVSRVSESYTSGTKKLEAHIALFEAYSRPSSRFFRVLSSLFVGSVEDESLKQAIKSLVQSQVDELEKLLAAAKAEGGTRPESPWANANALSAGLFGMCYRCQLLAGEDATPIVDAIFSSLFTKS